MTLDKIKICIIHPNFTCGGSERFISIICNHINTNIFDVELYVLDGEDIFYKVTNPKVKLFLLNIKNVRKSLFTILKILKKSNPDILFTASNHLNVFISIFKFLFPKKLSFVARESSIISINNKRLKYGKLYDWMVKKFYKNIDHIICQSVFMQNDLVINYNVKREATTLIYNPAEEIQDTEIASSSGYKNKYKFFSVGRLSPEKGNDRLLKALSLLDIEFTFQLVGDGPEKNNLQHLTNKLNLQNKVYFEGQKSHPYENMIDADLFLIGSYFEGFPNVLLEAGMLGIPVVGYNAPGGVREIIEDGVNGFLTDDDGTGRSFCDLILKAISYNFNRELIISQTKYKYSAGKITKQLEDYLQNIYQNKHIS